MGRVLATVSGKGGTGKTTACAAVSCSLAKMGLRVLCVDVDVGLRDLDIALGLHDRATPDFSDVLEGRRELMDAVIEHPELPGLCFLSAPLDTPPEDIPAERMAELLRSAAERFDWCVTDAPAGLGAGFRLALAGADMAAVVTTADVAACRDAQRAVLELDRLGIPDARLIVNRVRPGLLRRANATIDDVVDSTGARLLGIVPEDRAAILAANTGRPLTLYSSGGAAAAFGRIARRIAGEAVPLRRRRI